MIFLTALLAAVVLYLGVDHFRLRAELKRARVEIDDDARARFARAVATSRDELRTTRDTLASRMEDILAERIYAETEILNRSIIQSRTLIGIVEFLDDVPQNFAFHKVGINYQLKLPDTLRMNLKSQATSEV